MLYSPVRLFCWAMRKRGYSVMFYPDHFGHQTGDVEYDLRTKTTKLLYLAGIVANEALREIHERQVKIIDIPGWLKRYIIAADRKTKCLDERLSRDMTLYQSKVWSEKPRLSFTIAEHKIGRALLKKLKLKSGQYVCFHARDYMYGLKHHPLMFQERGLPVMSESIAFQRHRNSDFAAYMPTIEWLKTQGLKAVRLGSEIELGYQSPNLVDYADMRSTIDHADLCDLYLMAHCRMFVSGASGLTTLAATFNIPTVGVNWFPYFQTGLPAANIIICRAKRIKFKERELTEFESRHVFDFLRWPDIYNASETFEVIDHTPDEILNTVKKAMVHERANAA